MPPLSLFLLAAMAFTEPPTNPGQLRLTVTNLRNDNGHVRVSLYRSSDGFPSKPEKSFRLAEATIQHGRSEITLDDLPPGEYALALLHDENDNKKLDKNFLGIPQEGYGASNDAGSKFGPPKFQDAKFTIGATEQRMEIKVRYF